MANSLSFFLVSFRLVLLSQGFVEWCIACIVVGRSFDVVNLVGFAEPANYSRSIWEVNTCMCCALFSLRLSGFIWQLCGHNDFFV